MYRKARARVNDPVERPHRSLLVPPVAAFRHALEDTARAGAGDRRIATLPGLGAWVTTFPRP